MKILYGIQGTGHGHISRAKEILPKLTKEASVDVLISGYNCKLNLENVDVSRKRGISLTYDDKGGVSFLKTAFNLQPITFLKDLSSIDPDRYDLIISDYEPISAWASMQSKTPSFGLSHQASFLSSLSPRPGQISHFAEALLKYFAPVNRPIGFHFDRYDSFIQPPVIRQEIKDLNPVAGEHITVYLPSFNPEFLAKQFHKKEDTQWHIFSPFCDSAYQIKNVTVFPVGNRPFLQSLESAKGVIAGAGFELCAETMYLGKQLMAIPIKNQYEQLCNAAALQKMGVQVIHQIAESFEENIHDWLERGEIICLEETADIDQLIKLIIRYAGRLNPRQVNESRKINHLSQMEKAGS